MGGGGEMECRRGEEGRWGVGGEGGGGGGGGGGGHVRESSTAALYMRRSHWS